jgi:DNA-binding transcriptional LysR family regulator
LGRKARRPRRRTIAPATVRHQPRFIEAARYLPHILVSPRGDTRGTVDDALEAVGRTRKVIATCPSFLAVPFLVGASQSIAVIAERVALRMQDAAQLSHFELPVALPTWEVLVIRARGRANEPAVQWITNMMIAD